MTDSNPSPAPAPGPSAPTSSGGKPSKDECTMAMLCHILGIPTGFIGPLIIWLVKKDTMPFVDEQGKESLNFQITVFIAAIIAGFSTCIAIGFVLIPAVLVANLVLCIMATMKANAGEHYRYPFTLRLIK